ncbi:MAG: hypothetical protein FJ254_06545 [Phycisphaerae bacterium]|nr:hypothetical protein [Phycisphaerae bacterium]
MYLFWETALAVAVIAPLAHGAIINEAVPTWRDQPNTVFAGWESFASGYGGFNVADRQGSFCGCSLFSFGAGSALDADGNIRSASAGLHIKIVGGQFSAERLRSVVVNLATIDGAVAISQMKLRLVDGQGAITFIAPSTLEERAQEMGNDGSIYRTRAYRFDVIDGYLSSGAVSQWRLEFTSTGGVALDEVALDLDFNAVPSPGALALTVGGVTVARFRRR